MSSMERGIIGVSQSEPHIDEKNARNPYIIGASQSEPLIDELNVRNLYMVYYYAWYVRHPRAAIYIVCSARYIPEAA